MAFHWLVTAYALHGDSAEEIAEHYGDIPLATVEHALAFYLANRGDVDAWVAHVHDYEDELLNRLGPGPSYSELHGRLVEEPHADASAR